VLAWVGALAAAGGAALMWANLATFARVLDKGTVTAMNRGAATLALCSFCLLLLAYTRRTFGSNARAMLAALFVVVAGTSVIVPVALRGAGETPLRPGARPAEVVRTRRRRHRPPASW
jgi:hypothetical protein